MRGCGAAQLLCPVFSAAPTRTLPAALDIDVFDTGRQRAAHAAITRRVAEAETARRAAGGTPRLLPPMGGTPRAPAAALAPASAAPSSARPLARRASSPAATTPSPAAPAAPAPPASAFRTPTVADIMQAFTPYVLGGGGGAGGRRGRELHLMTHGALGGGSDAAAYDPDAFAFNGGAEEGLPREDALLSSGGGLRRRAPSPAAAAVAVSVHAAGDDDADAEGGGESDPAAGDDDEEAGAAEDDAAAPAPPQRRGRGRPSKAAQAPVAPPAASDAKAGAGRRGKKSAQSSTAVEPLVAPRRAARSAK